MFPRTCVLLLLSAGIGAGCGQQKKLPELFSVKGQLKKDGEPVKGGFLSFQAKDQQDLLIVNAAVDEDGKFVLITIADANVRIPGAPKGEYDVTYTPSAAAQKAKTLPFTMPHPVKIEGEAANFDLDIGEGK